MTSPGGWGTLPVVPSREVRRLATGLMCFSDISRAPW